MGATGGGERVIYVDGAYLPEAEARIPVMDRGFLFGEAIYEVTALIDGHLVDNDLHLARLERSLAEVGLALPCTLDEVRAVQRQLILRNRMREGTVYLQVTGGRAERDFIPAAQPVAGFVAFTQPKVLRDTAGQRDGVRVDLAEDPRWSRRDIKTTQLLGQVMAKRQAKARGLADAWLHQDGEVTESASSSAFIVTKAGSIVSRQNSRAILPGCTRRAVARLAEAEGLVLEERPIALAEIADAAEAFMTSASSLVLPVVEVGGTVIGDGRPGPMTRRLQALYLAAVREGERVDLPETAETA